MKTNTIFTGAATALITPLNENGVDFLDELDRVAARIEAVNTICIHRIPMDESIIRDSHIPGLWLKGYNTDIIGFRDSIRPLLAKAGITSISDLI